MIDFDCPGCSRHFSLRDELAGKHARCKCGQKILVPLSVIEEPEEHATISELLDEDDTYRLQVAAGSQNAASTASLLVECGSNIPNELIPRIEQCFRKDIAEHLERAGNSIQLPRLQIRVNRCEITKDSVTLTATLRGSVNYLPLDQTFTRTRRRQVDVHTGGLVANLIVKTIAATASAVAGIDTISARLQECATECGADMCLLIDRTAGRKVAGNSRRWRQVTMARSIGAVLTFIGVEIAFVKVSGFSLRTLIGATVSGMLVAAIVFFAVHCLGLAVMPTSFLRYEPLGRRAMARTGVKSVPAMRFLAVVLAIILLSILIGGAVLIVANWGRR